jgi:hypothetical protein
MTQPAHQLETSSQAAGTAVFNRAGRRIGRIRRLFVEVGSRQPRFADVAVGGLFSFGGRCYVLPWEDLTFDSTLHGYRVSQAGEDQIGRIDKPYVSPKRLLHGRW